MKKNDPHTHELREAEVKDRYLTLITGIAALAVLYVTSLSNYLLFHSLAELFSIVIAFGIFVIAWNSRPFLNNNYLLFVGIAYLFVGGIDLIHTLAYKGMGVFKTNDANHPTQLWIAARSLEALSLLTAPFFMGRRLSPRMAFAVFAGVASLLLWSIYGNDMFPVCYIDGAGLTAFKKNSEYAICLTLLLSVTALLRKKSAFDTRVLNLIFFSIATTIVSELAFTFYVGVYDLSNLVGHLLKIASFYFIYLAIIKTGIRDPFDIVFRSLKQREEELQKSKEELEHRVAERTLELSRSNERLQQENFERIKAEEALREQYSTLGGIIDCTNALIFSVDRQYRYTSFNKGHAEMMRAIYGAEIRIGQSLLQYMTVPEDRETAKGNLDKALAGEQLAEDAYSGEEIKSRRYFRVSHSPIRIGRGEVIGVAVVAQDLTERKQAEEALRESERKYRDIFDNVLDGLYLLEVTEDGRFRTIEINPALERSTGIPRAEAIGKTQEEAVPQETAGIVNAKYRRCVEAGRPIEEEAELKLPAGRRFYHSTLIPIRDSAGRVSRIIGISRDITERKQGEETQRRLNRELRAISNCNQTLMRATDEQSLLNDICRIICDEAGYRMAWVGYAENDEEKTVRPAAWAGVEDGYLATADITWADRERGRGPTGTAIRSGGSACIKDFMTDPQAGPWRENAVKRGYRSCIAMPLKDESENTFGALTIYSADQNAFTPDEIRLLEELAGDLAFGITVLRARAKRKHAEDQLFKREAELNESQRLAHIGSWDWNAVNDTIWWSDEYYRIYGLDKDKPTPNYVEHLKTYTSESTARLDSAVKRAMETGEPYALDLELAQPTASTRWIVARGEAKRDANGKIWGLRGTAQNITERKAAEEALEKSEAFIKNILESVDEGFIVIDRDFRILSANRAYVTGFSKSEQDVIGRHCYEISHHSDKPCFERGEDCPSNRAFATGEPQKALHKHTDGEGKPVYVETKAYPMKDEAGNVVSVIEIVVDVTEKAKLEEQLRQAQKMEAIGTLAGGVAHDFNNILTAIIGYGNIVKMKMRPDDPQRASIDQILASSDRAAHLTHGLLAFSRKQVINPKPVDVNNVVKSVEKLLRRLIGEDVELAVRIADKSLIVMADAGQIEQVLMNLATNARDAMPDGGLLTLTTEKIEIEEDFVSAHGYGKPGKYTLITVSDTGMGMDGQTREKIFEPFFTTKEQGKGTGLGLAIVYGIIKQHDGNINVYSEPGKGTTFKIYIPLIASEVEEVHAETATPPAGGTETILLAEDDQNVRVLTTTILRDFGYRVIEAIDGQDAVEKYAAHAKVIDLLLLDVVMPRKSGKEVYDAVKATRPDVHALFISGYTADIIHKKGIFEEGLQFISKPVSPFDLLRKIRELLDRGK